jgi:hypothetical protein
LYEEIVSNKEMSKDVSNSNNGYKKGLIAVLVISLVFLALFITFIVLWSQQRSITVVATPAKPSTHDEDDHPLDWPIHTNENNKSIIPLEARNIQYSFTKSPDELYEEIKKVRSHSMSSYILATNWLLHPKRTSVWRTPKLFGDKKGQEPFFGSIHINTTEDDMNDCVVSYASFNFGYTRSLKRIVIKLLHSRFRGTVLFRIGGWPNVEEGDLQLVHVPYAFKVSMIREAKRLGFKNVLYMDSSVFPLAPMSKFFDRIHEKGYIAFGNTHAVFEYFDELAAKDLKVTLDETRNIPSVSASVIGFSTENPTGLKLLNTW